MQIRHLILLRLIFLSVIFSLAAFATAGEPLIWPVDSTVATPDLLTENDIHIDLIESGHMCKASVLVQIYGLPLEFRDKPLKMILFTTKDEGKISAQFDLHFGKKGAIEFCVTEEQLDKSEIELLYASRIGKSSLIISTFEQSPSRPN